MPSDSINVPCDACEFCMRMLTDGLAEKNREENPSLDIAEILLESVETT